MSPVFGHGVGDPDREVGVFAHEVRVGYGDTDQGGIVHHAVYLRFLEQARVEFLRDRGISYRDLELDRRYALPVVEAHLRYRQSARFDDVLAVEVMIGKLSRATVRFDYRIVRGGALLCEASTTLACVRLPEMRLSSMPALLADALAPRPNP